MKRDFPTIYYVYGLQLHNSCGCHLSMTEMTGVTYVGGILGFKVVSGEENGRFVWFSLR